MYVNAIPISENGHAVDILSNVSVNNRLLISSVMRPAPRHAPGRNVSKRSGIRKDNGVKAWTVGHHTLRHYFTLCLSSFTFFFSFFVAVWWLEWQLGALWSVCLQSGLGERDKQRWTHKHTPDSLPHTHTLFVSLANTDLENGHFSYISNLHHNHLCWVFIPNLQIFDKIYFAAALSATTET